MEIACAEWTLETILTLVALVQSTDNAVIIGSEHSATIIICRCDFKHAEQSGRGWWTQRAFTITSLVKFKAAREADWSTSEAMNTNQGVISFDNSERLV